MAKKKKKQRIKDIDAKVDSNNDLLSAYTDAPEKQETPKPNAEPVGASIAAPKEDATWEDKEKTIDKEIIRNEDAEEPELVQSQQPRIEPNTIVLNEG